jgi:hypothetical protein
LSSNDEHWRAGGKAVLGAAPVAFKGFSMDDESRAPAEPLLLQVPVSLMAALDGWISRQRNLVSRHDALLGLASAALCVLEDLEVDGAGEPIFLPDDERQ